MCESVCAVTPFPMAGKGEEKEEEEEEEEEAAVTLLHHPSHPHPLIPGYIGDWSRERTCNLCGGHFPQVRCYSYTTCDFYAHRKCVKAPPLIPHHPLHPFHPLSLSHDRPSFTCHACNIDCSCLSSYGCDECGLFLDLHCVLFILPDPESSFEKPIEIPIHDHPLTSIPNSLMTRYHFKCTPCGFDIFTKEDGYMCLHPGCMFRIHNRCIKDLYYEDGSRVPRVYHQHELATFSAKEGKPIRRCGNCASDISSREHIGCKTCRVFYHRDCVELPEKLQYPLHLDHGALVLFIHPCDNRVTCQSCGFYVKEELCYRCTDCNLTLHAQCFLRILLYHEEGRAMEIALSWHEHPLILCPNVYCDLCSCCDKALDGLAYCCTAKDCRIQLHEGCTDQSSEINHPHHPEHPLLLLPNFEYPRPSCDACREENFVLSFSCELCRFYLHISCASQFPTLKHYLHEHDLIQFNGIPSLKCNRCCTSTDSPLLRCVPCDFNLHKKCTELPGVVKHKTHHHPLTLRDSFMEDDTGEYYCDLCEKRRDGRLGVYMCLQCKMEQPWVFHIECVLPELRGLNMKKVRDYVLKEFAEEVVKKEGQLLALEKKVEETKRELEELRKRYTELCVPKAQGEEK